jgi:hypothetical protein
MTRLVRRTVSERFSSSSWNGRRGGGVEHLDVVAEDLDLARGQVGVLGAGGTAAHLAAHLQHELVAHRLGDLEHLGAVGVAHHLHQALAVAQVDEDHAAVVAAAVHPAANGDDLVEVGGGDFAAVVSSHVGFRQVPGAERPGKHSARLSIQRWPSSFVGSAGTPAGLRNGGATTPIEMMYLSASSTLMSSSMTSLRGIIRKKPEVGLGVVGTYTLT